MSVTGRRVQGGEARRENLPELLRGGARRLATRTPAGKDATSHCAMVDAATVPRLSKAPGDNDSACSVVLVLVVLCFCSLQPRLGLYADDDEPAPLVRVWVPGSPIVRRAALFEAPRPVSFPSSAICALAGSSGESMRAEERFPPACFAPAGPWDPDGEPAASGALRLDDG